MAFSLTNTTTSTSEKQQPHLLALPVEILDHILSILFLSPPSRFSHLVIQSLFIRTNFGRKYLPVDPGRVRLSSFLPPASDDGSSSGNAKWRKTAPGDYHEGCVLSLLLTCRKLSDLVLDIIYSVPLWRAQCYIEQLADQIGLANMKRIKRLMVDRDDLDLLCEIRPKDDAVASFSTQPALISLPLSTDATTSAARRLTKVNTGDEKHCMYITDVLSGLEDLEVERMSTTLNIRAFDASQDGGVTAQKDLQMCIMAQKVLNGHPKLYALSQLASSIAGGADAIDPSVESHVTWKFVSEPLARQRSSFEVAVDIDSMVEELTRSLKDKTPGRGSSFAVSPYAAFPWLEDAFNRK